MCAIRKNRWYKDYVLVRGSHLTTRFRGNWIRCLQMVSRTDLVSRSKVKSNSLNSFNSLHSSLFATRSSIRLDSTLRGEIKEGLDNDTPWADSLKQLQSAPSQNVQQGAKEYRMARQLLEVRQCTGTDRTWRLVIPYVPSIKQKTDAGGSCSPLCWPFRILENTQKAPTTFLLARSHSGNS